VKNEDKKTEKEKKYFKNVKGWKRYLLFSGIYIFIFLTLLAISAEYTSRPSFCPTCHYMESFYQSWRSSTHNDIDCVECHFEPGLSGTVRGKLNGLVQMVNYVSLAYKKRRPWAEIPDNTCSRAGCHAMHEIEDSVYNFKGVLFSHNTHLKEQRRGKTLKCTSCHSQIVQGTHIEVTESTCFTCHFKKSDDPEHKFDKLSDCKTCHDWSNKSKEQIASLRYDHTFIMENKIDCNDCHTNTIVGKGEVAKERCYSCHFEAERLDQFEDIEFMHDAHIKTHSMKCFSCHSQIEHKVQQMDPEISPDCMSCHSNAHVSMVKLYTGQNAGTIEKTPSPMFLSGINCKGCHVIHEVGLRDITTSKAGTSACEKCHGPGYGKLMDQWKQSTDKRLNTINSIYRTVLQTVKNSQSAKKKDADAFLMEATHNIKIVEVGKSVHNVQFADKLLVAAYDQMKKALAVIGSPLTLPAFQSGTEFVPNECSGCHLGIQDVTVKKFGKDFSHNIHTVKNRLSCNRCHSNTKVHGELIINNQSCTSCHHSGVQTDDQCSKCHQLQVQMYTGSYMNKSQPDFMKVGGTKCIDCHKKGNTFYKPDVSICAKCHDNSYQEMGVDWKKEVNKLTKDLQSLIAELRKRQLNSEQQALVNEARKIANDIASHPSIYAHNYDLISTLLSEKIKELQKIK
jgi:hypothetical protein